MDDDPPSTAIEVCVGGCTSTLRSAACRIWESLTLTLAKVETTVVDEASAFLARRAVPPAEPAEVRGRLRDLFRQVVAAIERDDPGGVARYCRAVAGERIRSGLDLAEVLAVINALEEALWSHGVAPLADDDRLRTARW